VNDVNMKFSYSSVSSKRYKQLRLLNYITIQSAMLFAYIGLLCFILFFGTLLFGHWDLAATFLFGLALTAIVILAPILLNLVLSNMIKQIRFAKIYKKASESL